MSRLKASVGVAAVVVEAFGYLHGAAPTAHVTFDVRELLHNPHSDPRLRECTGLDPDVRDHVMNTKGARDVVAMAQRTTETLLGVAGEDLPVRIAFGCAGGRHRSVVLADALADSLALAGIRVRTWHRDIHRPVVRDPPNGTPEPQ